MTFYYGIPGSEHFWHWPTLVHFLLVALAGGVALYVGVLGIKRPDEARRLAPLALLLIVLDLLMLWAESPARFRFSHLWLFLGFHPAAAIWWGAWGLSISALVLVLLYLRLGAAKIVSGVLALAATVVVLYPGLALAANAARPLWDHLLLALFPATGLVLALAVMVLVRQEEAAPWLQLSTLVSLALSALYPLALFYGGADQKWAFAYWLRYAGLFGLYMLFLFLSAWLARRFPVLAAAFGILGAFILRSWIVDAGQHSMFATGGY